MTAPPAPLSVSIVVPVLDEADRIDTMLTRLRRDFPGCEIVVVDGGSSDGTADLARPLATVIVGRRGRGPQLNAGARRATGDVLWFHHADTAADPAALLQLQTALKNPRVVGGGLTIGFDRRSAALAYLAWTSNLRARRLGWIFGDQAMFVRRAAFDAVGGFPDLPIMEDLEMSRRLRRTGRLVVLPATSTASARRFEAHGTWAMVVFMQYLKALYFAGVDPAEIHRRYVTGPRSMLRPRLTLRPRSGARSRSRSRTPAAVIPQEDLA